MADLRHLTYFCLSYISTQAFVCLILHPQFFVCHIYSSNFFVCLILHLQVFCSSDLTLFYCQHCFTWRICIVQFLILYRCLQHESESWEGTKSVHQRNFHFISIRFCCCWGQSHQQRLISIVPSKLPFFAQQVPKMTYFFNFLVFILLFFNFEKNSKAG